MNIKILDSWLREYLKTEANEIQIAEALSKSSVSVEKIEEYKKDFIYDIEVTTNRPDLMSVIGIAREAYAALSEQNIKAEFIPKKTKTFGKTSGEAKIEIINDPKLVNRICASIMEVKIGKSPNLIKERLEATGIRSLNNLIDITNYLMREFGIPTHVFDYDKIKNGKIIIREAKKGEKIITLDKKEHVLNGGEIIADNGKGEIIDLLGIMGTQNSVVSEETKRILFFIDNNDPVRIRKASMEFSLRTEAAQINEKGVDRDATKDVLYAGIKLYEEIAGAKLLSKIIDIYPNKQSTKKITIYEKTIKEVTGIDFSLIEAKNILAKLDFKVKITGEKLEVTPPSARNADIEIEEDVIEEIARIYGYDRLPSLIPPITGEIYAKLDNSFYWERRVKEMLKFWGFTEIYTYSLIPENMLEENPKNALELANSLSLDMFYLRTKLIPSLLFAAKENSSYENIKIFEIANVYIKDNSNLPIEEQRLAVVIKNPKVNFFQAKGIIEQMLLDLGIKNLIFKKRKNEQDGADVYLGNNYIGEIEILEKNLVNFELNFAKIAQHASLKKVYQKIYKFPPVIENLRIEAENANYKEIVDLIKNTSKLVKEVTLFDVYENKKTFKIKYQKDYGNLTNEEAAGERNKIIKSLKEKLNATIT